MKRHNAINRAIFIPHRDCRAYKTFPKPGGYSRLTPKRDPERDARKAKAYKLEEIIKTHLPGCRVRQRLATDEPAVGLLHTLEAEAIDALDIKSLGYASGRTNHWKPIHGNLMPGDLKR